MIAIVDYDTGNLRSVANALKRLNVDFELTANPEKLQTADRVILPGVGEASSAMRKLRERGLDQLIPTLECPVLGICIGMQLMCKHSEEGDAECMGIFDAEVVKLEPDLPGGIKVPHMGWSRINGLDSPLFDGLMDGSYVYFVHSFAAPVCDNTIAVAENGRDFSAALRKGNFYGVQFHPEKSGAVGSIILENFLKI